jgi:hypothetical protein
VKVLLVRVANAPMSEALGGVFYLALDETNVAEVAEKVAGWSRSRPTAEQVLAKRAAAKQWVNAVSVSPKMNGTRWRYLLVRETDIAASKDSWQALKGFGEV